MAAKAKTKAAAAKPAAKKTAAPKAAGPNRVTLKHLAATLAEEHQITKKQGEAMLNDLVMLITKHLKKGERIRIAGLGILQVRKRPARMGRNPATGEPAPYGSVGVDINCAVIGYTAKAPTANLAEPAPGSQFPPR